jgi:hypothetical protein
MRGLSILSLLNDFALQRKAMGVSKEVGRWLHDFVGHLDNALQLRSRLAFSAKAVNLKSASLTAA